VIYDGIKKRHMNFVIDQRISCSVSDEKTYDVIQKSTRSLCWQLKDDWILICHKERSLPTIRIEDIFSGGVKC
jgi:predicted ribosome-associated RNA-binding protein Tma20